MPNSTQNLKKLLNFIYEISDEKGNEWFKGELIRKYSSNLPAEGEVYDILTDLKRSKFYLKSIDRSIWVEALTYYSKVKFPELKIELAGDYKEMKLADKSDDIIEFTRRLVMQLENCLNAICTIKNAHKLIQENPSKFQNNFSNLFSGEFSFFKSANSPKPLSKISIQSKIFFVKQLYEFNYSFKDVEEMITIRNRSSHRGELSERESNIIDFAKLNITERKSSYFKCFDTFFKNMIDIQNN